MRKRYQQGSLKREASGSKDAWFGFYRDANGKKVRVLLGYYNEMSKSEAWVKLAEKVKPVNEERALAIGSNDVTIGSYAANVYIPHKTKIRWKDSTTLTSSDRITRYIVNSEFGNTRLVDVDRVNMQAFLDSKGTMSLSIVNMLKWDLKAILDLAVSDDLIRYNKAVDVLHTPRTTTLPKRPVLTVAQVREMLAALKLRERLICGIAVYAGLHPSEIIALKWCDVSDNGLLRVDDRYYKGNNNVPKNPRPRNVGIPEDVMVDFRLWKEQPRQECDFMFPSERLTKPVRYENVRRRNMKPLLEPMGLGWVDWNCLRRTNASLGHSAHIDKKVSADNRGHGIGVALDVYIHSSDEQKLAEVNKLARWVRGEQA